MDYPSDPLSSWWPYVISLIVGIVTCIRGYMGGTQCPTSTRIDGKLAIVTGASSGIGLEITKELAKRGGHVIMCCRSVKKGTEAMKLIKTKQPNANLTLKQVDLSSMKSVRNFASCLGDNVVDILVNNAGIIFNPFTKTAEGHEIHLATNYFGHFMLAHLLMNNLIKSKQGRIINVSAGSYQSTNFPLTCDVEAENYISKEWFGQSKLALILMAKHMTNLLKGTNVTINAMNPGMVRGTQHLRHSIIMRNLSVKISSAPWMWLLMKSPMQGAQTAIYLSTDPSLNETSGKFFNDCAEEDTVGRIFDMEGAKILYDKTCTLLNIVPIEAKFQNGIKN